MTSADWRRGAPQFIPPYDWLHLGTSAVEPGSVPKGELGMSRQGMILLPAAKTSGKGSSVVGRPGAVGGSAAPARAQSCLRAENARAEPSSKAEVYAGTLRR